MCIRDRSSANIITARATGRSRGFGVVEMPDEGQGQSAIDALNGTEFEGMTISVNVARPKTEHGNGGGYVYDDRHTLEIGAVQGVDGARCV